jgi:hypothetical protein
VGSLFLKSTTDFTLTGNTLTFTATQALVTISYQTSALGASALTSLQGYYSPLLYEASFQAV